MRIPSSRRALLVALTALGLVSPGAAQAEVGPDYVSSDNVTLVDRIRTTGDGVGARVVGDYLYVTSTKGLEIFDIKSDPAHPKPVGIQTVDVEFENEEVPTNGKLLGISSDIGCRDATQLLIGDEGTQTGCLSLYDVSNPAAVRYIKSVSGSGNHTSTCVFDCTYFMGSEGAITDARNPEQAKYVGNWERGVVGGDFSANCHQIREIQPGIVIGSCQPIVLMSIRPQDGGSVEKPVVLATGTNEDNRFVHSSQWPQEGRDRFALFGGETNASGTCDDTVGAFMVWDTSSIIDGAGGFKSGGQFRLVDEVRPTNGTYTDGRSPYNALGCSVHWFQQHPSFRNGGLVANAQYEQGVRFYQVTPEGKIVEQGFFLPLGGSTSAPHWNPFDTSILYAVDYTRGVDVLKYTGELYQGPPNNQTSSSCAQESGFRSVGATPASGGGVQFTAAKRSAEGAFDVTVSQVSNGRDLLKKPLVRASFKAQKGDFAWDGNSKNAKAVGSGDYVVRFVSGKGRSRDTRLVALRRAKGEFTASPPFQQSSKCGLLSTYALSGPAFGGRKSKPLSVSYKLRDAVREVVVELLIDGKVKKTYTRKGIRAGKGYRLSIPAKLVKRGTDAQVRLRAIGNSPVEGEVLVSRRL